MDRDIFIEENKTEATFVMSSLFYIVILIPIIINNYYEKEILKEKIYKLEKEIDYLKHD
jgi:hypothetical protein